MRNAMINTCNMHAAYGITNIRTFGDKAMSPPLIQIGGKAVSPALIHIGGKALCPTLSQIGGKAVPTAHIQIGGKALRPTLYQIGGKALSQILSPIMAVRPPTFDRAAGSGSVHMVARKQSISRK